MNSIKWIILFLSVVYNENLLVTGKKLRIIGGNVTTIEQHPWMVSLQFLKVHYCGGSILSEDTIITAAHCVIDQTTAVTVKAGTADLSNGGTNIRLKSILIHEGFNLENLDYDIAILKLSKNLTFSDKIQPIFLSDQDTDVPEGTPVVTVGWGVTNEDTMEDSNVLFGVELYIKDWEACRNKLDITETMICAGYYKGGRDTCHEDSGGPLELNSTLIGIVSWGQGCGEADYPGVYSRVGRFRSWIKQHAGI